jgi:hypothetical protein
MAVGNVMRREWEWNRHQHELMHLKHTRYDIPYLPSGLQMMLAERPPTGRDGQPATTTDPWINYCEPPGL